MGRGKEDKEGQEDGGLNFSLTVGAHSSRFSSV